MTVEIQSLLGQGSAFEGNLVFDGVVRIDGVFKGRIDSKGTLVIGPTGEVEADVTVGTCVLEGSFKGTLKASELVEAKAPARMEGRVETPDIQVERGVVLDGEVMMQKKKHGGPAGSGTKPSSGESKKGTGKGKKTQVDEGSGQSGGKSGEDGGGDA